ncbi:platelet-activating factor acetylhydrolase [Austrofundulus limnaeus]|uniref:Platelet-activating factor acetylhydrolase n=1 Tax=Austrofundulus limnaeus TaxID=52670 RepID=A0A2I4AS14_AUSLI|nr:PREDICTED: platelet-activating factor acetylhydrolase-like [Austrofundulus limnaeus]
MGNSCSRLGIPPPKGPNVVGCTDFMMDHSTQGSFFRLYYPCQETEKSEKPDWVPSREYFNGLADFMKINRTVSERIFNYLFGSFKIPAYTDAPFKSDEKCPVVIFSHGLGAFRTLYSAICAELASQGFIVASVEHSVDTRGTYGDEQKGRVLPAAGHVDCGISFSNINDIDQSASATYYFRKEAEIEQSGSTQDSLIKEWMYYRSLRHGESEFPLRNQQVKQRADECILVLDRLTEINSGVAVQNVLQTQFDWTTLQNSMDLCRMAVMGHSFGGATAVEALCKEVKFKCGVALDAWMFPLDDNIFPQVKQPIFFINSEKFQWAGNISRMKKLESAVVQRKMITIRGTVHQSFPDFTFLTSNWIGKLMKLKGEIDPKLAMDLSNKATLAFLQRHLGLEKNFNQWDPLIDGQDDNLIQGTNIIVLQSAI